MGPITEEEFEKRRTQYVAISQSTGKLLINKKEYPAIEGKLIGFSKHEFTHNSISQVKFDIHLLCGETEYQVQFGFYSWVTLQIMNSLSSIEDLDDSFHGILQISATKTDADKYNVFLSMNGKSLKWKYDMEALKLKGLEKTKKETKRNKIIDTFYDALYSALPYTVTEREVAASAPAVDGDDDDDMPNF
jgi:hypothetical protein